MVCEAVPGAKGAQRRRKVHTVACTLAHTLTGHYLFIWFKWAAVGRVSG